jgi:hypothetical protein
MRPIPAPLTTGFVFFPCLECVTPRFQRITPSLPRCTPLTPHKPNDKHPKRQSDDNQKMNRTKFHTRLPPSDSLPLTGPLRADVLDQPPLPRLPHSVPDFVSPLPYNSCVTPLSTAFTHCDRGGRVRPASIERSSDSSTGAQPQLSSFQRLAHSLSPLFISRALFSAAYRLFLQIQGVAGVFADSEPVHERQKSFPPGFPEIGKLGLASQLGDEQ